MSLGRALPTKMSIYEWCGSCLIRQAASVKEKVPGDLQDTETQVDTLCSASVRSPRKPTRRAARHLNTPHATRPTHTHTREHTTMHKIRENEVPTLQHVSAQRKFAIHFALSLSTLVKPHSICQEMVIEYDLRFSRQ
jgi:hypothetical protein